MAAISGNAGHANASVSCFGENTSTALSVTADGSGNYSIPSLSADTYFVAVRFTGLVPSAPQTVPVSTSDVTGINFSFSAEPHYTYTQLAVDSLSGPNENPLNSAKWTVAAGAAALQVIDGTCESTTTDNIGWEFYSGISWPNNQYGEILIVACLDSSTAINLGARDNGAGDAGSSYNFSITGSLNSVVDVEFIRAVSGTITTVADIPVVINTNDIVRIEVIGSTIYFKVNSDIIYVATDSEVISGSPSIALNALSLANAQVKNFSGGSITETGGGSGGKNPQSIGTVSPTGTESSGSTQVSSRQTSVVGTNAGTQIIG